jgi:hypothetical protein
LELLIPAAGCLTSYDDYPGFLGVLETLAFLLAPMAIVSSVTRNLAADVAELFTALAVDVVTCLRKVPNALAEGTDLVALAAVGSVDEVHALLLEGLELFLEAVIEGLADLFFFVQLGGADEASSAVTREALADGGGAGGGRGSEFDADEAFALAVYALKIVGGVFQLSACVFLDDTRRQDVGKGVEMNRYFVDFGRVRKISLCNSVDHVG